MSSNLIAAAVNPWIGLYVDTTGNYTLIFVMIGLLPIISFSAVSCSTPSFPKNEAA